MQYIAKNVHMISGLFWFIVIWYRYIFPSSVKITIYHNDDDSNSGNITDVDNSYDYGFNDMYDKGNDDDDHDNDDGDDGGGDEDYDANTQTVRIFW